jgi:hypothetical protein
MTTYPARYTDGHGTLDTTVTTDGHTLHLALRGVDFAGTDLDALAPDPHAPSARLASFTLNHQSLCACRLDLSVPVLVGGGESTAPGVLETRLDLGEPGPNGGLVHEYLAMRLVCGCGTYTRSGTSGWFEDALTEIQAQLPPGLFLQACINCLFADYSPYGHGCLGSMMCFRNLKAEYLRVRTKDDLWAVHDRCDARVQETHLCPEFQRRVPGTGYRG